MIWNSEHSGDESRSAVVEHIMAEIAAVCGDPAPSPHELRELATGVAAFLEQQDGTFCIESKYVTMLASRALSSLGHERLAHRLLVFGTGLVRPSEWSISGGNHMLVLDLKQLTIRDNDCLELVLFETLLAILDSVADAWDATGGRGVLGLRHVCRTASVFLGCPPRSRKTRLLADEIKSLCARKLDSLHAARGWKDAPFVVNLDL